MHPERTIKKIIPYLLKKYDKSKEGVAIDIGIGTDNYYFPIFQKENYKTFAIEPLPCENLLELIPKTKVVFINECISDYNGTIEIYTGRYEGNDYVDVSSTNFDWWGIDKNSKTESVSCRNLKSVIEDFRIKKITYFKVDTEGTEFTIIKQFEDIPIYIYPEIIEFEYGGGGTKMEGKAGWSEKYYKQTLDILILLKKIGYKYMLIFEREVEIPIEANIEGDINFTELFQDQFVYGNILIFRDKKYSLNKINLFCKPSFLEKFNFFR